MEVRSTVFTPNKFAHLETDGCDGHHTSEPIAQVSVTTDTGG
jgi:hypothetical protein